jgi:hypothetical protein
MMRRLSGRCARLQLWTYFSSTVPTHAPRRRGAAFGSAGDKENIPFSYVSDAAINAPPEAITRHSAARNSCLELGRTVMAALMRSSR